MKHLKNSLVFLLILALFILSSCHKKENDKHSESDEIKLEEKIIANSPGSFDGFLYETVRKLKNHIETSPYPKKGEFETTEEYSIRIADWNARGGIGNSILFKATSLFPVKLGKYYADSERFGWIEIRFGYYKLIEEQGVYLGFGGIYRKITSRSIYGKSYWTNPAYDAPVVYPREKARLLREDNLRCDIVFSLNFASTPDDYDYRYSLSVTLHNIKFYSPETGDIIFQASSKK